MGTKIKKAAVVHLQARSDTVTLSSARSTVIGLEVADWRNAVNAQTDLVSRIRSEVMTLQEALKEKEAQLYLASEHLRALSEVSKTD